MASWAGLDRPSGLTKAYPVMIKPTSPLASSTIISVSLGVTEPSWSANPSQVADRTKRLASVIPFKETLSNNSAIFILQSLVTKSIGREYGMLVGNGSRFLGAL